MASRNSGLEIAGQADALLRRNHSCYNCLIHSKALPMETIPSIMSLSIVEKCTARAALHSGNDIGSYGESHRYTVSMFVVPDLEGKLNPGPSNRQPTHDQLGSFNPPVR